ncbi:MAG: 1-deoxy-D-xylulose-5-phosphate synthase [Arenicella sp.]
MPAKLLEKYPTLAKIDSPSDLRDLSEEQLPEVCEEVRGFLIDTLAQIGGHFAAGLGTVELTTALHYVYNTPEDRIVWDIGHQAYPHKILTGRRDQLHTIRQEGGLSGFLKREESEYDTFGAGHSSTSISAALGMAVAAKQAGIDREAVAIIGDGALTAGMAYEALNNAGDMDANMLVILNDNEMSISRNVGAMSNYLARILSGKTYTSVREGTKVVLRNAPGIKNFMRRWEEHAKGMIMPGTLFEELGFYYIGPIDGHDIDALVKTLQNLKEIEGPKFLHIVTQKGKGYKPAEDAPIGYHAVSKFDVSSGEQAPSPKIRTFTKVFSDWLCDEASQDDKLLGITPAMREGSGLVEFSEKFPNKYFDVGIAEQHALTFAAGIACDGYKPVVAIYSSFLQRAYDQFIHDISIQDLDVTLAIDRAGLVGADGETHAGAFDLSFMRCIPNIIIFTPSDESECRNMLHTAYQYKGFTAVRYPRGAGIGASEQQQMELLEIGKGIIVRETKKDNQRVAILNFGTLLHHGLQAAEKIDATVVDMRFVKPIDEALITEISKTHDLLVTLEENVIMGGAGAAVSEFLNQEKLNTAVLNLGLPDHYIHHGTQDSLLSQIGLDSDGISQSISDYLKK